MKAPQLTLVAISALLAACLQSTAATIYVPGDQPTIQAGIDAATYGDIVLVACDTYYEHDITMKSGVCLTSETGEAGCVTIDAQQQGRVICCLDVDDAASIVGFTVTGGLAPDGAAVLDSLGGGIYCENSSPTLLNCTFSGNQGLGGGGLACWENANPTLMNCTFSGNGHGTGGGMFSYLSSPTLTDCTFSDNTSESEGGGMACIRSFPALTDCEFSGNIAGDEGGGMACVQSSPALTNCEFSGNIAGEVGGGVNCFESSPTLTDCAFSDNTADGAGGGMGCFGLEELTAPSTSWTFSGNAANAEVDARPNGSVVTATDCTFSGNGAELGAGIMCMGVSAEFTGCTFSGNTAAGGEGENYGGGILYSSVSPATVTNCTFSGNYAELGGGGIAFGGSSAAITSCTFSGNTSEHGGGILCGDGAAATLTRCIVAFCGGGGAVRCIYTGSTTLFCSDVYGNVGGDWEDCIAGQDLINDNFGDDPLFCDAAGGDFTIDASSLCCAENNQACGLVGAWDIGCDTSVEGTSWGAIKSMFR